MGDVSGNEFRRPATLVLVDTIDRLASTNGINPIDFCISSGNPLGNPEVGALRLGSNLGCLPGASVQDYDLGYVEFDGARLTFEPDDLLAGLNVNTFTPSDDFVMTSFYTVDGGSVTLAFDGQDVSGTIEVRGFCGFCGGGAGGNHGTYRATLTGEPSATR